MKDGTWEEGPSCVFGLEKEADQMQIIAFYSTCCIFSGTFVKTRSSQCQKKSGFSLFLCTSVAFSWKPAAQRSESSICRLSVSLTFTCCLFIALFSPETKKANQVFILQTKIQPFVLTIAKQLLTAAQLNWTTSHIVGNAAFDFDQPCRWMKTQGSSLPSLFFLYALSVYFSKRNRMLHVHWYGTRFGIRSKLDKRLPCAGHWKEINLDSCRNKNWISIHKTCMKTRQLLSQARGACKSNASGRYAPTGITVSLPTFYETNYLSNQCGISGTFGSRT